MTSSAHVIDECHRSIYNVWQQIRTIVRAFRDKLPEIFPGRTAVPKTLVFAKTDSPADDIITTSFHLERDDLEMAPFDAGGGLGRMYQLFGDRMEMLIKELNEALVA